MQANVLNAKSAVSFVQLVFELIYDANICISKTQPCANELAFKFNKLIVIYIIILSVRNAFLQYNRDDDGDNNVCN